jgi:hypothetical protein
MRTYEDIVKSVQGFLDINGEGMPTEEQWAKIVEIISSNVPVEPPAIPTHPLIRAGQLETITGKRSIVRSGAVIFDGFQSLDNSLDVDDVIQLSQTPDEGLDSKILEVDSVTVSFSAEEDLGDVGNN